MISIVQPLFAGNALRLYLEPPSTATRWKVLRKGSGTFTGHDDASAIVAYDGDEQVFVDHAFLQNEVMAFYCPFYTADDGVTWAAGPVASGTPTATYEDTATDALSLVRERLEAGLKVEVERGNLVNELGYVQVLTAPPSLERDLILPLVTVHLENEEPSERAIGEDLVGDWMDAVGDDGSFSEGWLASVSLTVIGWSLNPEERIELRKAIRRIVVANLPVFSGDGMEQVQLSQQDIDAVNGEYPAPMYQVMNTITCLAPVRVSGVEKDALTIREVISRRNDG